MRASPTLAETYARWRATKLGGITERLESSLVFELLGPLEGKRVLDVGTGDGTYAITASVKGATVTGLDIDREMLDAARARAVARGLEATWVEGRCEALPFADASFDNVVAVTVLCFVADPELAVREMARVLVPGGRLVIGELGRPSVWAVERRIRGWFGSSTWSRARFWSQTELAKLFRSAGFEVAEVRGAICFPPIGVIAGLMAGIDPVLGRLGVPGAAFLVVAGEKAEGGSQNVTGLGSGL